LDDARPYRHGTRFVTILGWILIACTAVVVASTLLQSLVFTLTLAMPAPPAAGATAPPATMSSAFKTFLGLLLGLSVLALASAIAFLKRLDWARRTFILLFALTIGFTLVGLVLLAVGVLTPAPDPGVGRLDSFARSLRVPMAVGGVVLSGVLAWLIRRLTSPAIRREFGSGAAA
jgi:hypothetical protein